MNQDDTSDSDGEFVNMEVEGDAETDNAEVDESDEPALKEKKAKGISLINPGGNNVTHHTYSTAQEESCKRGDMCSCLSQDNSLWLDLT